LAYATNGKRQNAAPSPTDNAINLVNARGQNDWTLLPLKSVPQELEKTNNFPFRPGTVAVRSPSWSADGHHVAVAADGHTGMVLSLDDSASDLKIWLLNYEGGVGRTAFAPKGGQLAIESKPASGYVKIVVVDTAGAKQVELGSERLNVSAESPAWAPDGQRLAAISYGGAPGATTTPRELLVFGADGLVRSRITGGNVAQPAWNPTR
jgi:Tol biopolymer transport system component